MSESEDGQLKSPGDVNMLSGDEYHDTDSLDIKPPQASGVHVREGSGVRRKEKSMKEKRHSREKKHKDRGRDIREDESIERDRRGDVARRDHSREMRFNPDVVRYERGGHEDGVGHEHEESHEIVQQNERRSQKYYDRSGDELVHHNYRHHHHQPLPPYHHSNQIHMQRHDYYNHRGHGYATQYNRHPHNKHGGRGEHLAYHNDLDMQHDRRKYNFEPQKDPESLEQDLRSRLLSKRHKYVHNESDEYYDGDQGEHEEERFEKNYEERENKLEKPTKKLEHHKTRREKKRVPVIEVLDSPELSAQPHKKQRKHQRRNKERISYAEKRKTPDDPELKARKAKLLAGEREKEKLKEVSREELEARRELRREHEEVVDVLSPANVTDLSIMKRKLKRKTSDEDAKEKRLKLTTNGASEKYGTMEETAHESDMNTGQSGEEEEEASNSGSSSRSELNESSYKKHKKTKKRRKVGNDEESDGVILLPDSPVSIGDLSKSPPSSKMKKQHKIHSPRSDDELDEPHSNSPLSVRSRSSRSSRSSLRTGSHSSRSLRQSRSDVSHSYPSWDEHSRSQINLSHSHTSSRSRSRSPSEERDMKANAENTDYSAKEQESATAMTAKSTSDNEDDKSSHLNEKGQPLPNYFPGIQGCRSVEEFQWLNRIEEGTYGVVYRARDKRTNEIVALKRLKMEREKEGFPITSLREINTLLKAQHPNIVTVREIVMSNMEMIFIVMDYVEHDLKSLMETMKNRKQRFFPGEVKCLIQQLLQAVKHLHDNWILHRDLKTSNLLLSHKGILKVGDFGLAREYGSPLKHYTSRVVTLWYRAPELLLGPYEYSTPIDIWSVGCIFGEFLQMSALFPGQSEIEQLNKIFKVLGTPNEKIWPGYNNLPAVKNMISQNSRFAAYPVSNLGKHLAEKTTECGISLLQGLLTYNPNTRLSAEKALAHPYFQELPLPIEPSMFPTWPAKSELGTRKVASPKPPPGGSELTRGSDEGNNNAISANTMSGIITGNKKTAPNTGFVLNAGMDQRQMAMGPGFNLKF